MKTMMLTGIRQMQMKNVDMPQINNENEVLIRMKILGVCGSDVHYYTRGKIGSQVVNYPFAVGHEGAGIVERVGNSVKTVKPGDRIAIEPAMPCFDCDQCKAGRHNTCRNLKFLGCPGQAAGCLSEFIVMPVSSCLPIPDEMTFDEAAISEPLSIGLYAVRQSGMNAGAKISILGFGPIGMSVMLCAQVLNAGNIFVTDKLDTRLNMAKFVGVKYTGNPDKEDVVKQMTAKISEQPDIVFECCGKQEAMDNAIDMVKPGGKVMIIGIPEFDTWNFNVDKMRRKEISVVNIRRQNHCTEEAIKLITNKKIDVSTMPTHRFAFEDTKKAFDLVAEYNDGVMKAMIEFD